jgi:hypothetical protein
VIQIGVCQITKARPRGNCREGIEGSISVAQENLQLIRTCPIRVNHGQVDFAIASEIHGDDRLGVLRHVICRWSGKRAVSLTQQDSDDARRVADKSFPIRTTHF